MLHLRKYLPAANTLFVVMVSSAVLAAGRYSEILSVGGSRCASCCPQQQVIDEPSNWRSLVC